MRTVGLKILKNKLSEYVRLAASETVLVTDRNRVVAEIVPPGAGRERIFRAGNPRGLAHASEEPASRPTAAPSDGPVRSINERTGAGSRGSVIYLDSSVALARLFGEGRTPRVSIWAEALVSSQLLEYEVWNRVHARGAGAMLAGAAEALLEPLTFLELSRPVLTRALQPFPIKCARLMRSISQRSNSSAMATKMWSLRATTTV